MAGTWRLVKYCASVKTARMIPRPPKAPIKPQMHTMRFEEGAVGLPRYPKKRLIHVGSDASALRMPRSARTKMSSDGAMTVV